MHENPTIWYVIADGGRARILRYRKDDDAFERVTELVSATAHLSTKDLGSDKPGRAFESAGGARHAIEPRSDFHEKGEVEFARVLAANINEGADRNDFQLLALVAPSRFIHAIKDALKSGATERLFAEVDKDLTKLPEDTLRERLLSVPIPHRIG